MFFEMLFGYAIAFILGVLALAAVLGYGVATGDLKIERTADREARKLKKKERQKEEAEQKLLEELSKGKKKKTE